MTAGLCRGDRVGEGADEVRIIGEQLVSDDHPGTGQRRDLVDRQQADVHAARLEAQRLVVAEARDELDVAVASRPSTWLNCGYSRIVTSSIGQPAGIEQRQQRVPRRPEPAGRPDRHPGQVRRIGWARPPASPISATGNDWYRV